MGLWGFVNHKYGVGQSGNNHEYGVGLSGIGLREKWHHEWRRDKNYPFAKRVSKSKIKNESMKKGTNTKIGKKSNEKSKKKVVKKK